VDIGIVPEGGHLKAVGAQDFNGLVCAGSAANMEQSFHNASKIGKMLNFMSISWKKKDCKGRICILSHWRGRALASPYGGGGGA
jgi:hypothetical protein